MQGWVSRWVVSVCVGESVFFLADRLYLASRGKGYWVVVGGGVHSSASVDLVIFSIHLSGVFFIVAAVNFLVAVKNCPVKLLKGEANGPFCVGVTGFCLLS